MNTGLAEAVVAVVMVGLVGGVPLTIWAVGRRRAAAVAVEPAAPAERPPAG